MPFTYDEYRQAWNDACTATPPVPLNIDIELSSLCNLRCPFCFVSHPKYSTISHKFMARPVAEMLIREAADLGVPALKFNWRGEATLNPEFLPILKKAASYSFHDLIVNTNGNYTRLSVPDALMLCTKVIFSVDSFDQKTYESMRVHGDQELLFGNIAQLLEMGHRGVILRRVVTDANRHENFALAAKSRFGEAVTVSEHMVFERSTDTSCADNRVYCGYPSQRIVVDVDGTYAPCCVDIWHDIRMGSVYNTDLMTAWKGIEALRSALKAGKLSHACCQNCTSWLAYDNPARAMVTK